MSWSLDINMRVCCVLFAFGLIAGLVGRAEAAPFAHGKTVPAAAASAAARASGPTSWRADVARYAQRLIHAGLFPGMGIAVTRGDAVVYVGSFGVADARTGRRVDDSTRFYIASTTKALTATAVMMQAAHGELRLDAPITKYLPDLRFKAPLKADAITLRDLLSMTDGIGSCEPVGFRTAYTGVFTQKQLIRLMRECGPSETGRAFAYRNLPYNILGMALSPGKKNGWKNVVRKDVLDPLGMNETTAFLSTLNRVQVAMPHKVSPGKGFERIRLAKADANLHAAGGYFTTPRDLARFVAMNAADGMLEGKRIFPAKVIASMHAKHADQDRNFGSYHRFGWGYGWDLGTFEGHVIVHRFGGFSGYRTHVSFMPDSGIGVVVLVNGMATPFAIDQMANYIYARVNGNRAQVNARYDAVFKKLEQRKAHFAKHFAKQRAKRLDRQNETLAHPLQACAGVYANPSLGTMHWKVHGKHLVVSMGVARSRADIYAARKNQFRVELAGGGQVVTFLFKAGSHQATGLKYGGYLFQRVRSPK